MQAPRPSHLPVRPQVLADSWRQPPSLAAAPAGKARHVPSTRSNRQLRQAPAHACSKQRRKVDVQAWSAKGKTRQCTPNEGGTFLVLGIVSAEWSQKSRASNAVAQVVTSRRTFLSPPIFFIARKHRGTTSANGQRGTQATLRMQRS